VENVQVFIRIRPPFQSEIDDYIFNPGSEDDQQWKCTFYDGQSPQLIELSIPKEVPKEFTFDRVFNEGSGQSQVFEQTCKPLVLDVLNGYNGTYFVYGQTGTGKTYTMGVLGNIDVDSQGIIPQSVDFMLKYLHEQEDSGSLLQWRMHLSFYQIYQD